MNARDAASGAIADLKRAVAAVRVEPRMREVGRVLYAGNGIAVVAGLPNAQAEELVSFDSGVMGIVLNLDEEQIGCVLLGDDTMVSAGDGVRRTGEVVRTPVGERLLGRIVDPLGQPLDGLPPIEFERYMPVEREAPAVLARASVATPLVTGIKSIDAMIPVGRGQRELIIGDRSTGKTTIGIDAILSQADSGVVCVYVAIGQRASSVAGFIATLQRRGAMDYTVVVAADADSPPGMRYIAPYAGCTISEYFMEKGRDTLIVYDDLTKHAATYREISLLLRRPPGREAYPGDVFYIHSRLLERATQLDEAHGGGSQTALPIIETQAQNLSAYIPTNLISITDGQIYLSPSLYQSGFLPAVDIGTSVSRVGGKTQLAAMKRVAQELRLSYTQFQELEEFTKFGTTFEPETMRTLEKGRRLRELLKQPAHRPVPLPEQALLLLLAAGDALTDVPVDRVAAFEDAFRTAARERLGDLLSRVGEGEAPSDDDAASVEALARQVKEPFVRHDKES
ncbi:MAG: F0F1 ATP synthase subunit alpha [Candidatus Brocadiaceae bacterium]|nr:F0F1 ATP synthase subunit alpha [Candidatus Brocadiaceae bacterium]